jgi:hypothetical protein
MKQTIDGATVFKWFSFLPFHVQWLHPSIINSWDSPGSSAIESWTYLRFSLSLYTKTVYNGHPVVAFDELDAP